ncbi:MAG: glycosyltransferase family 39 protein [Planctomycetes bacterium]|nr:glycosyltransferase family 39 protein [Planctomycetota bacterium]
MTAAAVAAARRGLPSPRLAVGIALAAWALLVAARLTAPSDLLTRDQERVAAYVLDATERGHWLCQEDFHGNIASKPPLFNWLAALATECVGSLERFALAFPSWLCSGLTTLLVLVVAGRLAGRAAGVWAAILYLYSQLGLRQVLLVRSDAVFQATVFAATVFAWQAWETGRGHVRAWLAAALATLTKGPLAILLVAFGFVAAWQERRAGRDVPPLGRRGHLRGIVVFLLVTAGWFVAADVALDGRVWDKLIVDELVGHAVGTKDDFGYPGERFYRPAAWFVTRLFPMGAIAVFGLWRAFRRPSARAEHRRLERLLAWQVALGVALFSLASENRFVHLLPLMPGAAVLAGRELDGWLARRRPGLHVARAQLAAIVVAATLSAVYLSVLDARNEPIVRGADTLAFARAIERIAGPDFAPANRDAPDALFAHLTAFAPPSDDAAIAAGLAGTAPYYVATIDADAVAALVPSIPVQRVLDAPLGRGGARLTIVANRSALPIAGERRPRIDSAGTALFLALVAAVFLLAGRRAGSRLAT